MLRIFAAMFSRKWILATILVFAGTALCVRLGFWQLDRLAQRRAFNAHVTAMRSIPPLDLNSSVPSDLADMEYRQVTVTGHYDYAHQTALRNQYYDNQLGYHLLTPLMLDDSTAVLVDRGWIPAEGNPDPEAWRAYDGPDQATVAGILRPGRTKPDFGGVPDPTLEPGQTGLNFWNLVNLDRISLQMPYALLPAYIQPAVDPADDEPPIPFQPEVELSEGPHLGYAGQWFTFAVMLFFGYPFFYLRKQVANP